MSDTLDRPLANRVMYDALFTFIMRLLNVACAAGLGILTARLLGPAGKGAYALPAVEAGIVAAGFSGLGSATSFFLLNRESGKRVIAPALVSILLFVAVAALAIVPLALLTGQRWTIVPAILALPSAAILNFASGYALGVKRVRYTTSISVATTFLTFVLTAAALFLVARTAGVAIAVWIASNAIIALAAIAAVLWHARRLRPGPAVSTREFATFGAKVGMVNLVSLLNYRADLYIVALLAGVASLGIYTVAVSAAESLLVPTQVAALVTSPHIASLDVAGAGLLTSRCVRNNLLIAFCVCGLLAVFAGPIVRFFYGAAFLQCVPALQVLLIGVVALSLASPMSSYFTLKLGRPEVALKLAGASALVCIAVSVILVPRIGMLGAAIGSTVAYGLGQGVATWYFSRVSSIRIVDILVPTLDDLKLYAQFALRAYRDGLRLLGLRPVDAG